MTTTALDLIESAMSKIRKFGAGDVVSAEDAALGLRRLNSLMTSLESEGLFNYTTTNTVVTLPANTQTLTIGPTMQIDMVRPVKILRGSFSRLSGVDYPLEPVSEQEYNAISIKTDINSTAPVVCFYDGGIPTGLVYFWPEAVANVQLHLVTPAPGGVAADTTTVYDFPPGYERMVEYNLAVELAPDFNVEPSQRVITIASSSRRSLKRTNHRVSQLDVSEYEYVTDGGYPAILTDGY